MKVHVQYHIGAKTLVCRYEGCDMAYSTSDGVGQHERIKHGQTYPKAVKLGLVAPPKKL